MDVDNRAEKSPGASLPVHMEHPENLQNRGLLRTMKLHPLWLIALGAHLKESDSPDGRGGEHLGEHVRAAQ